MAGIYDSLFGQSVQVVDWEPEAIDTAHEICPSAWPPEGCDYDGVPAADPYSRTMSGIHAPAKAPRQQAGGFLAWYFNLSPLISLPLALIALALILLLIPVK
jgi:hypothetical protein